MNDNIIEEKTATAFSNLNPQKWTDHDGEMYSADIPLFKNELRQILLEVEQAGYTRATEKHMIMVGNLIYNNESEIMDTNLKLILKEMEKGLPADNNKEATSN